MTTQLASWQLSVFFGGVAATPHNLQQGKGVCKTEPYSDNFIFFIHILDPYTWYHHPRRLQCVLRRNLRIFKVATWHYRCRHNLKNNCIWDNLQCCLLMPRSPSKPVMLTFDLQSRNVLFIEIGFFGMYNLERQFWYWHLLMRNCPCNLFPQPTSPKHEYREKLWVHPVTSKMTSSP